MVMNMISFEIPNNVTPQSCIVVENEHTSPKESSPMADSCTGLQQIGRIGSNPQWVNTRAQNC